MEEKEKTQGQLRREALLDVRKNGYDHLSTGEEAAMKAYCEDYKKFLDAGKTEREVVDECVRLAQIRGFVPFTRGMTVKPGDNLTPMDTDGVTLYGTDFVHEDTGLQGWVLPGNTGNFIVLSPSGRELMGIFQNDIVIQEAPTMAPGSP